MSETTTKQTPTQHDQGARTEVVPLAQFLESQADGIARVLPRDFPPEKFMRQVLGACRVTPRLQSCDRKSLLLAISNCAALGLEPVGGLQSAHLVPFNRKGQAQPECVLIIGYRGLVKLMLAGGAVVSVNASAVHANDLFENEEGSEGFIRHVPALKHRGAVVAAFAVAKLRGGGETRVVLNREEIDQARASSRNSEDSISPWSTHYAQMAAKTAVRRLANLVPLAPATTEALGAVEAGEPVRAPRTLEAAPHPAGEEGATA